VTQPLLVRFIGGTTGAWQVESLRALVGDGLDAASRLDVVEGPDAPARSGVWELRGVTSHERYVERAERAQLVAAQEGLGRPAAVHAALIPIRKSPQWWALTQDERRDVLESRSRHIAIGLEYLPAVARRLVHCRDLGEEFDFLTWFEFAPAARGPFDDLLGRLRETEEWSYVEREVEVRLSR